MSRLCGGSEFGPAIQRSSAQNGPRNGVQRAANIAAERMVRTITEATVRTFHHVRSHAVLYAPGEIACRGRCTVNVVPSASEDSTSMRPPCALTIRSAM
jgi:hypothetical protein